MTNVGPLCDGADSLKFSSFGFYCIEGARHRLHPHPFPPDNTPPQLPTKSTPEPEFADGTQPCSLSLASREPYRIFGRVIRYIVITNINKTLGTEMYPWLDIRKSP